MAIFYHVTHYKPMKLLGIELKLRGLTSNSAFNALIIPMFPHQNNDLKAIRR